MPFLQPDDTVYKIISMPRWQREWINSHRSINFSGLVQEMLVDVIRERDPKYFETNKKYYMLKNMRKKDSTKLFVKSEVT